jgi:carbon monoxide dehydrogenase subunit G
MTTGSASTTINASPDAVWTAIADVTRMGDWSPECTSGRWVGGATGPAVGAKFEGDNVAKFAGRTVKKWTTTSEVTECEPGKVFTFVAEGMTTWRYAIEPAGTGSKVTESYDYEAKGFIEGFVYGVLLQRPKALVKGMAKTLARIKSALEA